MATLALSAIGSAIGGAVLPAGFSLFGLTLAGAAIGRAVGGIASAYIDNALFGATYLPPMLACISTSVRAFTQWIAHTCPARAGMNASAKRIMVTPNS